MNDHNMPQIYGGLQTGKVLSRGIYGSLTPSKLYDINLNNIDCKTQVSMDILFDQTKTPTSGALYLYRKSMFLRGSGLLPVPYAPRKIMDYTDLVLASTLGLNPGCSFVIDSGIESVGLIHTMSDGAAIYLENLYYAIRIVDQSITMARKE